MEEQTFCGLDVHKESVQACVIDEKGSIIKEQNFNTTALDLNKLAAYIQESKCVMESSTSCFQIYDFLKKKGITVRVAHPKKTKAIASAKIKTDKIDARILAKLERADFIAEAYIPSIEVRRLRDLAKHHKQLKEHRKRIINQLKALLLKNSIRISFNPFTKKAEKLLAAMEIPHEIRLMLNHARSEHALFTKDLKEIDEHIKELAKKDPNAVLIDTMPGVASLSAFIISSCIDKIERFPSSDHLVSYAGLCPTTRQSGEKMYQGKASKDSNKLLRWILIQDAWAAVRYSDYFKKMFEEFCKRKKKQYAIVTVAKKMLIIMYSMLKYQTVFKPRTNNAS